MRIMGLDYGSVTVGVAISDTLLLTAQGIETIRRKQENKLRQTLARIEQLIEEYEVEQIILGYPKNMNNTIGDRCRKTEEFAAMLERRTGLEIKLFDERLSTVAAHNAMIEADVRREKRYEVVDTVAATVILQNYLDFLAHTTNHEETFLLFIKGKRMEDNKLITFTLEDDTEIHLEVIEETKINGVNYLLVVDKEEEDSAMILREEHSDEQEITYIPVEDDDELQAISKVFSELLEDIEFEK